MAVGGAEDCLAVVPMKWYLANLKKYWPWWVALYWLGMYELWAAFGKPLTLSRLAWTAEAAWPPISYLSTGVVLVLLIHFWRRNRVTGER